VLGIGLARRSRESSLENTMGTTYRDLPPSEGRFVSSLCDTIFPQKKAVNSGLFRTSAPVEDPVGFLVPGPTYRV